MSIIAHLMCCVIGICQSARIIRAVPFRTLSVVYLLIIPSRLVYIRFHICLLEENIIAH